MHILGLCLFPHGFDLFQIDDLVIMLPQVVMGLLPSIHHCQNHVHNLVGSITYLGYSLMAARYR